MTTQYYTATSIDGFIADADHSLDWLFPVERDTDKPDRFDLFFGDVGAMAMGSTTYEWVVAHEGLLEHPEKWGEFYGSRPTWVFSSRSLPRVPGAALTFVDGDVRPVHAAMTEAAGDKNVWVVGGGDLAGQFADHGLLDEIILGVAPVTLGSGAPLLPRRLLTTDLRLVSVDRDQQLAMLTYSLVRGG